MELPNGKKVLQNKWMYMVKEEHSVKLILLKTYFFRPKQSTEKLIGRTNQNMGHSRSHFLK